MLSVCVSAGVFALLQAYAFLQYLKDRLTRQEFQTLFFLGVSLAAGVVFLTVIYLTYTGEAAKYNSSYIIFVQASLAANKSSDLTTLSRYRKISRLVIVTPPSRPACMCLVRVICFASLASTALH